MFLWKQGHQSSYPEQACGHCSWQLLSWRIFTQSSCLAVLPSRCLGCMHSSPFPPFHSTLGYHPFPQRILQQSRVPPLCALDCHQSDFKTKWITVTLLLPVPYCSQDQFQTPWNAFKVFLGQSSQSPVNPFVIPITLLPPELHTLSSLQWNLLFSTTLTSGPWILPLGHKGISVWQLFSGHRRACRVPSHPMCFHHLMHLLCTEHLCY